jgi:hypothetical protein
MLPYDRAVKRLERRWHREALLDDLRRIKPATAYADCLNFTIRSGSQKAAGYAAHLFLEIFGTWPRPCDRGPPAPLPNFLIDEWAAGRKRKARPRQP